MIQSMHIICLTWWRKHYSMGTCICMWLLIEVTGGIVKHQPNAAKLIRLVFTSLYQFILVFTIDAELLKIEDCNFSC